MNTSQSAQKPEPRIHAGARALLPRLIIGSLLLLVAAGSSAALVLEHFGSIGLPGCGPAGGCGAAARSVFGSIPPLGLPTSSLGLAYFTAVLVGYIVSRANPGPVARWIARLGVLASLGFIVVSFTEKILCPYCIASHAANFAFLLVLETTPRAGARKGAGLVSALATFLVLMGALGLAEANSRSRARDKAEQELRDSTREAIARSQAQPQQTTDPATNAGASPETDPEPIAAAETAQPTSQPTPQPTPRAFTGRYRLGPEVAPVRIVIFSDYQCPECKGMEKQALDILAKYPEVSLSAKHFPFSTDCNRYMPAGNNKHPNACRAARATEAAGIAGGNDAFWLMHQWVFSVNGVFTDQELSARVLNLGIDPARFTAAMNDPATSALVSGDVEEGMALGVQYTPTVFINGVEFRGVINQGALMRAVEALLASNPAPATAASDQPPGMRRKIVEDWLAVRPMNDPVDDRAWSVGPEDAPLRLSMWGDYSEPFTARADAAIRQIIASRADLRYTFRHYPVNRTCNPYVQQVTFPFSCAASRAAETAGELAGEAGYWHMHDWLLANQSDLNEQKIVAEAMTLADEHGFDLQKFMDTYRGRSVQAALDQDIRGAQRVGVQSLPTITLNGRKVPRWIVGDEVVLDAIIDEAARLHAQSTQPGAADPTK
ncbi:MAG: thioredoxin domain-containing protein [Phycisphaeraceae bacterium]|nr:MAG: thioredoxin domain-containing protein [Phycisphaeraceae bacterium]